MRWAGVVAGGGHLAPKWFLTAFVFRAGPLIRCVTLTICWYKRSGRPLPIGSLRFVEWLRSERGKHSGREMEFGFSIG